MVSNYHLDVTFDNTLGKHSLAGQELRYDYFNLEDKKIFRDHEPLIAPAPSCTDGDHFYYREKKLSFTKIEDVYKRSLQAAKKGRLLTFHWRGGYLTKEVFQELLEQIKKAGDEKQKAARISVNWAQAVIRVSFVDAVEDACIDMEEANGRRPGMTCSPSTVYGSVENVTFSGWEVLSISVSESNRIFVAFSESVLLNVQLFWVS